MGRAPLLLAAIDRSPARGLARGRLVESPRNVGYMLAGLSNAALSRDPAGWALHKTPETLETHMIRRRRL
jgi:hypothetical protein